MLIHEDHAHLTWCPDARVMVIDATNHWGIDAAGGNNRIVRITDAEKPPTIGFVPAGATCVGRMCAAWRAWPVGDRLGYCGRGGPPSFDAADGAVMEGPNVDA